MIRIIRTKRLAALTGDREQAEARTKAVQLRLARIKSERDGALADIDGQAVLAQQQAARLEGHLRAERQRAEELADDLTTTRAELAQLRQVEVWLQNTVMFYMDLVEKPVEVLVRDGVAFGVQRTRSDAQKAAQAADPTIAGWSKTPVDQAPREGWFLSTHRLPEVPDEASPHYKELRAYYGPKVLQPPEEPGCPAGRDLKALAGHLDGGCTACPERLRHLDPGDLATVGLDASGIGADRVLDLVMVEMDRRLAALPDHPFAPEAAK
ncbi:hypothetical protein [Streptomyces chrestomyceticus]|uniref:hypothetical protein n=1 Tax=Streptomyces chrestomyceticus TaxID=68185 RepID=UPI0033FFA05A